MYQVGDRLKYVGRDGNYEDDTVYVVGNVNSDGGFSVKWDSSSGKNSADYGAAGGHLFILINDQGWQDIPAEDLATLDKYGIEYETRTVTQYRIKGGK